jgi:hypothetical protein
MVEDSTEITWSSAAGVTWDELHCEMLVMEMLTCWTRDTEQCVLYMNSICSSNNRDLSKLVNRNSTVPKPN